VKGNGLLKRFRFPEEAEVALVEGVFQRFEKEAAEQAREHTHGQKEARLAADPAFVTGRKTSARHDTVDMGMVQFRL
jgi:hypothetical protein